VWVQPDAHYILHEVSGEPAGLCAHSATTSLLMNDIGYWEGYFNTTVNFPYAAKQYNIHNNAMNNTHKHNSQITFNPLQ
jgi:hypothetical protein